MKPAIIFSAVAVSLMLTACGTAPKEAEAPATEATNTVDAAMDANETAGADANAADAKMASPDATTTNNTAEDDDRGGDPGARKLQN